MDVLLTANTFSTNLWSFVNLISSLFLFLNFVFNLQNENQVPSDLLDSNIDKIQTVRVRSSNNVELNCTSGGFPLMPIQWRSLKTNKLLKPSRLLNTTSTLVSFLSLKNAAKKDAGEYACELTTNETTLIKRKVFTILIETKPNRPIVLEANMINNQTSRFVIFVDDFGNSPLRNVYIEWSPAINFTDELYSKNYSRMKFNLNF